MKPGSRHAPMVVHRARRDAQYISRFVNTQTGKVAQPDYFCAHGVDSLKARKCIIDGKQFRRIRLVHDRLVLQFCRYYTSTSFEALSLTCVIDADATQRFAYGGKKMAAIIPVHACAIHQSQVRLMDKCSGLERVSEFVAGDLRLGQAIDLLIYGLPEALPGAAIAIFDGVQEDG